jgi:hypothetical protein
MKCAICGGWISASVIIADGKRRVGLKCNKCSFTQARVPGVPFNQMIFKAA